MLSRWFKFALVLYVALDFANPLMPGAVNFDPDTSVDGITAHHQVSRSLFVSVATSAPVSTQSPPVPHVGGMRPTRTVVGDWLADVRRAHSGPSEPPLLTEDH